MPFARTLPLAAVPLALSLVAACDSRPATTGNATSAPPTSATAPAPTTPVTTAIDAEEVANATISGVFLAPLTMKDGIYEGDPIAPGASTENLAVLMTPLVRLGELDAHAGVDAAALIASNNGRSAERITLAVVGLVDGKPVSLGAAPVGDRIRVRDLRIAGRDIVLDVVEGGPDDQASSGTQLATKTFRLEGATLTQVGSQVTGRLSLASTVAGHTWTAVAIDGTPVEAGIQVPTLAFADGRLSGTSGCNPYSGPVSEPKPGTLAMGPTAGTRRACAGPAGDMERRFLQALAKATEYTFLSGRLVLSGLDGERMRSLTFSRVGR